MHRWLPEFWLMAFLVALGCRGKKEDEGSPQKQRLTASAGEESGIEENTEPADKKKGGVTEGQEEAGVRSGKILMIIACDQFRDEELEQPKRIFEQEGMKVTVASNRKEGCRGMMGGRASVDALLSEVEAKDFEAVVFVGGVGSRVFFDDSNAHRLAQNAAAAGKVIAAICIAPSILARAGVCQGKRVTVWAGKEFIDILKDGGCTYSEESITVDGKLVTANAPQMASQFARKIIDLLKGPHSR